MRTRIKVCGITNRDDAFAAIDAGVDALGFILFPPSPRSISMQEIVVICKQLPPFVNLVAVLIDPARHTIDYIEQHTPIDTFQFHGNESKEFLDTVSLPYYKKITLDVTTADLAASEYANAAAILADTPVPAGVIPGGTGKPFDWSLAKRTTDMPFIVSGGLDANNVAQAIAKTQPYGVDVNSSVENSPRSKNTTKLKYFVRCVQQADAKFKI